MKVGESSRRDKNYTESMKLILMPFTLHQFSCLFNWVRYHTSDIPAFFLCFRMECYKCITETLDYLLSTSQAHPQAPSVPRSPGPPPPADPNTLSNTDAAKYVSRVVIESGGIIYIIVLASHLSTCLLRRAVWQNDLVGQDE